MKGTVFLLVGNFGVGKSTIVNAYPHNKMESKLFTEVQGLLSLGGVRGADELNKMRLRKPQIFMEVLPAVKDMDILIHSVFFQTAIDVERYLRTHNLIVIYLKTSYQENAARIAGRKDGQTIKKQPFINFARNVYRVEQLCKVLKVPFFTVDNNRGVGEVTKEVWDIIFKHKTA